LENLDIVGCTNLSAIQLGLATLGQQVEQFGQIKSLLVGKKIQNKPIFT
jgi:hypothetical protein